MRGFTLIELLIVLTITLFFSMLLAPIMIRDTKYQLEQELEKMVGLCDYLGQRAIATNQAQELFLDQPNNCYFFLKNSHRIDHKLPPKLAFSFVPGIYGPPGDPTSPIAQAITFPGQNNLFAIKFFSNGKTSAGTAYIADKQHKSMGALTCTSPQVSYMRRYVYKENHWILLNY